jgi:predicted RNase H-like nuclease
VNLLHSVLAADVDIAGVDGCKAGWITVVKRRGEPLSVRVCGTFSDIVAGLAENAIIAVDMPIGLPTMIRGSGRTAEIAARKVLSKKKSSIFSIPSREAVYSEPDEFPSWSERSAARKRADTRARQTSEPPRGVSHQAFSIFPKIRDIDALLRSRPSLIESVFESHPEVAFRELNMGCEMHFGKKSAEGASERKQVLRTHGLDVMFLELPSPKGSSRDDFLDAAVMLVVAGRLAHGEARSFPDPPENDDYGIPVAIWA